MSSGAYRALAAAVAAFSLLALVWVLEIADSVSGGDLDREFAIPGPDTPGHEASGLWRIFTGPFFHGGFDHLMANSGPLVVLAFLAALSGVPRFAGVTAIIIAVSGLGVWFFSDPLSQTIGASGLVFGYFGYLLARGFVERRASDIVVAALVLFMYGTMILGVFPSQPGVSWQAHLFGFIGGILAAATLRQRATAAVAGQRPLPGAL